MKVVKKAIEVVSVTDKDGKVNPIKFRIEQEDQSYEVIKIDRVQLITTEK